MSTKGGGVQAGQTSLFCIVQKPASHHDEFLRRDKAERPSLLVDLKEDVNACCAALRDLDNLGIDASAWTLNPDHRRQVQDLETRLSTLQSAREGLTEKRYLRAISPDGISVLENALSALRAARRPVIGYLFVGSALRAIEEQLAQQFPEAERARLPRDLPWLQAECGVYRAARACGDTFAPLGINVLQLLRRDEIKSAQGALATLVRATESIRSILSCCPAFAASAGIDTTVLGDLRETVFAKTSVTDVGALAAYLQGLKDVERTMAARDDASFTSRQRQLQNRLIFKMSPILD